jgi:glycosyltransferase involved in cell wall biosynthesis
VSDDPDLLLLFDRRRRVLFSIGGLSRGGSETQLTRLLENLPQPLTNVDLAIHNGRARDYRPRITALGVPIHTVPRPRWVPGRLQILVSLGYMAWTVLRLRPDVIYAWLDESALHLAPVGRLARVPVVVARRNLLGSNAERATPWIGRLQRRAERMATLVTANSQAVAEQAARRGIDPERIRIVRNGHDQMPPLPLPAGEEIVIGYLANFRPLKGHAAMLDAAALLAERPGWRLLLGGGGRLREHFRARIARGPAAGRIELTEVDDPRAFWARCHIAVLLSDSEGSPNALIEAAFAGRPIVASAVGGTADVVGEGAGILVPPRDPQAAADAIASLLDRRESLAAIGKSAWEHASATFTITEMVEGHVRVLAEALRLGGRA